MSEDKELQVRLQFLEEAQEYLDNIESGLLGLGSGNVSSQHMDGVLRAAHSIKGGAAMMGFEELSNLAHRLEDFFKVLKVGKTDAVDENLESLLLESVKFLRQIASFNRQQIQIDHQWLDNNVSPIFEQLHQRLGDPQPEDDAALLSAEMGEDMSTLIFETEVEESLQQLELILESPDETNLSTYLLTTATELAGLGEILELPAFTSLCQSIIKHLEATPEQLKDIAKSALQALKRSQALILIGQTDILPTSLDLTDSPSIELPENQDLPIEEDFHAEAFYDLDDSDLITTFFNQEEAIETSEIFSGEENVAVNQLEVSTANQLESLVTVSSLPSLKTENANFNNLAQTSSETETENLANKSASDNTIRVSVKQLEQLSDFFGEITIERNGLNLRLNSLRNLVHLLSQRIKNLEQSNFQLRIAYDKVATEAIGIKSKVSVASELTNKGSAFSLATSQQQYFDSLEMDSYSDLHLLSQEVMETVVQIQEVTKDIELSLEDTERNAKGLNRTTKQMQAAITKVRMRPLSDLVSRFPLALRNMEMQYGKKVQLKVRGSSTLIDRSILEALNDPLLHLFRNAFDHGIEDRATRIQTGKPEQGVITISASYRGNQTVITLGDDGGGINLEKIRARAVSIGISEHELANAGKEDLLELIFEPGFSTAEQVTDLSGRGVGMDVVRTNIEQVNGKIQVDTELGIGTTFTISVPFTLSVVRVLLLESNDMLLAFPTNIIEEMLVLNPDLILEGTGSEVLNWEGFMVRLVRLHQWLHFSSSKGTRDNEATPLIDEPTVLIIAQGNDLVGIQVDRYWQEEEVTIRQVEGNVAMPPGFTGCTILGDGRVVPLVDAIALLNWIENDGYVPTGANVSGLSSETSQNKLIGDVSSTTIPQKHTVMVVDDSINVRRFLAMTLEKANYRVEQAKDGQDALEKLQAGIAIRAIICDIEMPRLDGFGFLSRSKSDAAYKNIPVIMLTSRSGDKHRRLAMNLGANAYFSKPFKEKELLRALEGLIVSN